MRIGQVSPLFERVPPRKYGGTELVVSLLTEELVRRGHDVTLFASGDSVTSARLVSVCPGGLRLEGARRSATALHLLLLEEVARRARDLDLVHFHTDVWQLPFLRRLGVPHVTTAHGRLDHPDLPPLYREYDPVPLVSISDAQRAPLPDGRFVATVYHGLPRDMFTPGDGEGGHLLFLGRFSPEKRCDRAIEIASRAGIPLLIAAKIDPADREYFESHVRPLLSTPGVEYVGEVGLADKQRLLASARALLFPIDWPEPFGLAMIEAFACGTPVVAWRCGSVPEVVTPGLNGFVVESIDEAVAAVEQVANLDRRAIRRSFEERFTVDRMTDGYLAVYDRILGRREEDAAPARLSVPAEAPVPDDPYRITAVHPARDERTRVLKQGETFGVFDIHGDVRPGAEEGLYHEGTRYLSWLLLHLAGRHPILLGSTVIDSNDLLVVDLTNPDVDGAPSIPQGAIHLLRTKLLWEGSAHERIRITSHAPCDVALGLELEFGADWADVFEVRGMVRPARGVTLPPVVERDRVVLAYDGRDGVRRRTAIRFDPAPVELSADRARFALTVRSGESIEIDLTVTCEAGAERPVISFAEAAAGSERAVLAFRAAGCRVRTSNPTFNAWIERSLADLSMLTTATPEGPYPYAGVPWYSTVFGRDGILTALQCLWVEPGLARGVLRHLAAHQAESDDPARDAEPGKILHERRWGEMAALGEHPFGLYYGSVDATPLFVMLAGAYQRRTGDHALAEELWPNVERAIGWLGRHGDIDGDGLVEYGRRSADGLRNHGWKDSADSIMHADGSLPDGPIALVEVQGYAYAAYLEAARLAALLGHTERADALTAAAARTRRAFEERFFCDELGTYGLALDGEKRLCRVRSSNPGHCLFAGIASPARAAAVAASFTSPDLDSGFGVRTLAAGTPRYNPVSYHNGSIWPHDNAILAAGLARYGHKGEALHIASGLFAAARTFDLRRLPELFCGFPRRRGQGPTVYPMANSPQAWAAAAPFLVLASLLGLVIDAPEKRIELRHPVLPPFADVVELLDLDAGGGQVSLRFERHEHDVAVRVISRDPGIEIAVLK